MNWDIQLKRKLEAKLLRHDCFQLLFNDKLFQIKRNHLFYAPHIFLFLSLLFFTWLLLLHITFKPATKIWQQQLITNWKWKNASIGHEYRKYIKLARTKRNIGTYQRISGGSYIIPFEISSEISHTASQQIQKAMAEVAHGQCIEFRDIGKAANPASEKKDSYLSFAAGAECQTLIGTQHGENLIELSAKCLPPAAKLQKLIKLILYNLGMDNEESRPKRDNYVKIHTNLVAKDSQHVFTVNKQMPAVDVKNNPYDYYSIMHSDCHAGAIDPKSVTIEATPNGQPDYSLTQIIGQAEQLTQWDRKKLKSIYNKCGEKSTENAQENSTPDQNSNQQQKSTKNLAQAGGASNHDKISPKNLAQMQAGGKLSNKNSAQINIGTGAKGGSAGMQNKSANNKKADEKSGQQANNPDQSKRQFSNQQDNASEQNSNGTKNPNGSKIPHAEPKQEDKSDLSALSAGDQTEEHGPNKLSSIEGTGEKKRVNLDNGAEHVDKSAEPNYNNDKGSVQNSRHQNSRQKNGNSQNSARQGNAEKSGQKGNDQRSAEQGSDQNSAEHGRGHQGGGSTTQGNSIKKSGEISALSNEKKENKATSEQSDDKSYATGHQNHAKNSGASSQRNSRSTSRQEQSKQRKSSGGASREGNGKHSGQQSTAVSQQNDRYGKSGSINSEEHGLHKGAHQASSEGGQVGKSGPDRGEDQKSYEEDGSDQHYLQKNAGNSDRDSQAHNSKQEEIHIDGSMLDQDGDASTDQDNRKHGDGSKTQQGSAEDGSGYGQKSVYRDSDEQKTDSNDRDPVDETERSREDDKSNEDGGDGPDTDDPDGDIGFHHSKSREHDSDEKGNETDYGDGDNSNQNNDGNENQKADSGESRKHDSDEYGEETDHGDPDNSKEGNHSGPDTKDPDNSMRKGSIEYGKGYNSGIGSEHSGEGDGEDASNEDHHGSNIDRSNQSRQESHQDSGGESGPERGNDNQATSEQLSSGSNQQGSGRGSATSDTQNSDGEEGSRGGGKQQGDSSKNVKIRKRNQHHDDLSEEEDDDNYYYCKREYEPANKNYKNNHPGCCNYEPDCDLKDESENMCSDSRYHQLTIKYCPVQCRKCAEHLKLYPNTKRMKKE